MVKWPGSLGRTGLFDWMVQRITAVVLLVFLVAVAWFFMAHPLLDYTTWQAFWQPVWMKLVTMAMLLSLGLHAWVGLWTITTDYIKPYRLRQVVQALIIFYLTFQVVFGIQILWE